MARYFFDLRTETRYERDDRGVELDDVESAVIEARRSLLEAATEAASQRSFGLAVDVRSEAGALVCTVALTTSLFAGDDG